MPACGRTCHSGSPFLGIAPVLVSCKQNITEMGTLTLGICTARSTVCPSPSFGLTDNLFAQLPTTVISAGGWKATFQLVSSVGRGVAYGTATSASSKERDAVSGCCGSTAGIDEMVS